MSPHEQGTHGWFQDRCGQVTASRMADVIAKTKSGYAAARGNYMAQLAIERLTGLPTESFTSSAMQWGTETEPEARSQYEVREGVLVQEVGYMPHPTIDGTGASPDGLIGSKGLEIKCPNSSTHIETIRTGTIPKKYMLQMHWQMACAQLDCVDFLSYDPRLPAGLDYWLIAVERDDDLIAEMEREVEQFLSELTQMVDDLLKLKK